MRTNDGTRGHLAVIPGALGLVAVTLLAGCGSSTKRSAPNIPAGPPRVTTTTTPAPTTPTTTASTSTTPAPTTTPATTPAPTTPATTTVVGLTLNGSGTTFTPPAAPTTVAYTTDCQSLVDPGFYGQCVTFTSPSGTIAAIVEQQQQDYQQGQPITPGQERDLVYREVGSTWSLVLRRTPVATGEGTTQVYESDIMRDGDPKAVFVEPAANSQFADEVDIVDGGGTVTLYRQLHGGFATVPSSGGLETYVPDPVSGYDETTIAFTDGLWKITAASHVSDSQAQSLSSTAFFDPQETQATTS